MSTEPDALRHLLAMSDQRGLFEHARGNERRLEHGYCTDDNARLLVVASRAPDGGAAYELSRLALHFVRRAQDDVGRCRNRMDPSGRWTDAASTEDCWGRSLWGFGVAAAHHDNSAVRRWARQSFDKSIGQRSPSLRSMAFAALGAAEIADLDANTRKKSHDSPALALMADMLAMVEPVPAGAWQWPEPRLRYGNASLAEAVIASGVALQRPDDTARGIRMLAWLLDNETVDGHLSVTGHGGYGPHDSRPQFDQQPIEVAAMADACQRAYAVTGDPVWARGVAAAAAWFRGGNDVGLMMYDDLTGGGYDGLHAERVNLNQGAESTLAFVSTMQRAELFESAV